MNIRQIAEKAGVSVATVSRVLNHPENVADKTREKIERIMEETEYKPNWFAQGLNFKKTGTIGIMIPQVLNPVHMITVKGAEDIVHQKNYISFMCDAEENAEKERRYLELLMRRHVDGLLFLSSCLEKEDLKAAEAERIPVVLVGECKCSAGAHKVSVDLPDEETKAVELKLTAIEIPFYQMGVYGAQTLFSMIEEGADEVPKTVLLEAGRTKNEVCGTDEKG